MSREVPEALLRAIEDYEKAFGGDPKFRRALVHLDDFRRMSDRLHQNYDSPGRQEARHLASQHERPKDEPEDNGLPKDFETAARMAHERFSESQPSSDER